MKKSRISKLASNKSGIILLIVLWILVILTALVVSLGRNTNIELSLAKHSLGKVKAKYLSWGAMIYAVDQLRLDTEDQNSNTKDNLYYCGIRSDGKVSPEQLFKGQKLGDGEFEVFYEQKELNGSGKKIFYGMQDEERRININALQPQSSDILVSLLTLLGIDDTTAKTIGYSVVDWKDEDSLLVDDKFGAEDDYYMGLSGPYHCKNIIFDSIDELILVRGMTPAILEKIRPYVTVFGKQDRLVVNFDTASELVLKAIAVAEVQKNPTIDASDADSLLQKVLAYRRGEDGIEFTADDQVLDRLEDLNPNQKEQILYLAMNQYRTKQSEYFRIRIKAKENNFHVQDVLETVVQRSDLATIYWHRQ